MLLVLQAKSDMSVEGSLCIDNFTFLLTVGECIEDKRFILSFFCGQVQHTCVDFAHVSFMEWGCTGDAVRGELSYIVV